MTLNRPVVDAYLDGLVECPVCHVYFVPEQLTQRYCSWAHRQKGYRERKKANNRGGGP